MSNASVVRLVPLLRRLLDLQVDQESEDNEGWRKAEAQCGAPWEVAAELQTKARRRTPWEVGVELLLAKFQVLGIGKPELREHLLRVRLAGIDPHAPLPTDGKTGKEFEAALRTIPLGGIDSVTPLSVELARLGGEGYGSELLDALRLRCPEEMGAILAALPPTPKAVHNADFTMASWFGREYHFALGIQSAAVRALWEEWERSGLGLHQETIRNAVDAERDSFRMDTTFRNHPAFGTMIQRCGDGRYQLVRPDNQSALSTRQDKQSAKSAPKSRRKRG